MSNIVKISIVEDQPPQIRIIDPPDGPLGTLDQHHMRRGFVITGNERKEDTPVRQVRWKGEHPFRSLIFV